MIRDFHHYTSMPCRPPYVQATPMGLLFDGLGFGQGGNAPQSGLPRTASQTALHLEMALSRPMFSFKPLRQPPPPA